MGFDVNKVRSVHITDLILNHTTEASEKQEAVEKLKDLFLHTSDAWHGASANAVAGAGAGATSGHGCEGKAGHCAETERLILAHV